MMQHQSESSLRRFGFKILKIGVRHGVLGACVFGVINAVNVEFVASYVRRA